MFRFDPSEKRKWLGRVIGSVSDTSDEKSKWLGSVRESVLECSRMIRVRNVNG